MDDQEEQEQTSGQIEEYDYEEEYQPTEEGIY